MVINKVKTIIKKHYAPVVLFIAFCIGTILMLYVYGLIESIVNIHPYYE